MTRIVTYNIHACIGTDRRHAPERVADLLAGLRPDIVALQEVDVGRRRTGGVDHANLIAKALGMEAAFHPSLAIGEGSHGDAILTRLPMRLVKAGNLPGLASRPQLKPRGAVWVEVQLGVQPLQVVGTHLGLIGKERVVQANALLGMAWLGAVLDREPLILAGDFNAPPPTAAYRYLRSRLQDAQASLPKRRRRATFPSRMPILSLDHVFFQGRIKVERAGPVHGEAARLASDHLPLAVDFEILPAGDSR